jgi:hypothetical protein
MRRGDPRADTVRVAGTQARMRCGLAVLVFAVVIGCGDDAATPGPATAPADPAERFVRDYQAAGFFAAEDPGRTGRRITRAFRRAWGEAPDLTDRADQLTLLAYDRERAWSEDVEQDVIEGNDVYVDVFRDWSRIAAGDFEPRAVHERWKTPTGPVIIEFELDGRSHRVTAQALDDYLDLCVLTTGLNPLIADSGRQFAVYTEPVLGQVAFVVAVTDVERRVLEQRGWPLESRPCA